MGQTTYIIVELEKIQQKTMKRNGQVNSHLHIQQEKETFK